MIIWNCEECCFYCASDNPSGISECCAGESDLLDLMKQGFCFTEASPELMLVMEGSIKE